MRKDSGIDFKNCSGLRNEIEEISPDPEFNKKAPQHSLADMVPSWDGDQCGKNDVSLNSALDTDSDNESLFTKKKLNSCDVGFSDDESPQNKMKIEKFSEKTGTESDREEISSLSDKEFITEFLGNAENFDPEIDQYASGTINFFTVKFRDGKMFPESEIRKSS